MGTFFFFLFLKHVGYLTVNDSSFLGDPTVPSSEGKVYGGLRFWLKRLVERLDMIYVRVLVWSAIQG